jgi:hypothetical protein
MTKLNIRAFAPLPIPDIRRLSPEARKALTQQLLDHPDPQIRARARERRDEYLLRRMGCRLAPTRSRRP